MPFRVIEQPKTTGFRPLQSSVPTAPLSREQAVQSLDPLNKNTTFMERAGTVVNAGFDLAKGIYNTGKKILKSVATAPITIATGGAYAPEGTYAGETRQAIESGMNPALAVLQTGSSATLDVATAGELTGLIKNKTIPALTKYGSEKLTQLAEKKAAGETAKITEMISPKATVKEARLAQAQGRFVEGKPPTLFRGGTADTILPSAKTKAATETIAKEIPNASKLSESQLYSAVDKKITETATKLRPVMESTPIKPQTIEQINNDWQTIKQAQIAEAPATEEINVAKRQAKFEALLRKSGNQTHADLWDTRIAYDNSIPEAVKKANILSPETYQLQKDEWLQNRDILNRAIESTSRPEFKTMSNLYEAKNGILSKTKVERADLSKLSQFFKDHPAISAALKGAGVYEILKQTGAPLP